MDFSKRSRRRIRLRGQRNLRGVGYYINEKRWLLAAFILGIVLFSPRPLMD